MYSWLDSLTDVSKFSSRIKMVMGSYWLLIENESSIITPSRTLTKARKLMSGLLLALEIKRIKQELELRLLVPYSKPRTKNTISLPEKSAISRESLWKAWPNILVRMTDNDIVWIYFCGFWCNVINLNSSNNILRICIKINSFQFENEQSVCACVDFPRGLV